MTKKNKLMVLILVALVTIYFTNNYFEKYNSKSILKSQVLNFDPDNLYKIIINSDNQIDTLIKANDNWLIVKDRKKVSARTSDINSIFNQLSNLKIERLVSNSNKDWGKYELTDSLTTSVEIFETNESSSKIYFGKTDLGNSQYYNSGYQNQLPISYVRVDDDSRIYQIYGYYELMFSSGLNSFRNNQLFNLDSVISIEISRDDSVSRTYNFKESKWITNTKDSVDLMKMDAYVKYISKLNLTNFYDDSNLKTSYLSKLKLINEQNKEFVLYAYSDTISEDYVVTSSENSNNYFRLKDKEEYSKIFFEN